MPGRLAAARIGGCHNEPPGTRPLPQPRTGGRPSPTVCGSTAGLKGGRTPGTRPTWRKSEGTTLINTHRASPLLRHTGLYLSSEELCDMRVKEAPAHALRAMFAGIGSVFGVTDKLRKPVAPEPPQTVAAETNVT